MEAARPACPRRARAPELLRPGRGRRPQPLPAQPRRRSLGPGAPGACGASPERPSGRGAPRLAASWPRRRRWLDTAGPLGRLPWVPRRLPRRAAPRAPATPRSAAERSGASAGPPARAPGATEPPLPGVGSEFGEAEQVTQPLPTSCELCGASGLVDVVAMGCVCVFLFLKPHTKEGRS